MQQMEINGVMSDQKEIKLGVPQGSILGHYYLSYTWIIYLTSQPQLSFSYFLMTQQLLWKEKRI